MAKKKIKNKKLKDFKSFLGKNFEIKNIGIDPLNLVEKTKSKITNFYEDYKKNKAREKIRLEKQKKLDEKRLLLKEKKRSSKRKT